MMHLEYKINKCEQNYCPILYYPVCLQVLCLLKLIKSKLKINIFQ